MGARLVVHLLILLINHLLLLNLLESFLVLCDFLLNVLVLLLIVVGSLNE